MDITGAQSCVDVALPSLDVQVDRDMLWWPWQMGPSTLHEVTLTAEVSSLPSVSISAKFGIRSVKAELNHNGYRAYQVNGQPIMIVGAGWASDLLQRTPTSNPVASSASLPHTVASQMALAKNIGLNTIRLEGQMQQDDFFDLADELGNLKLVTIVVITMHVTLTLLG